MTNYEKARVKLSKNQLKKIDSPAKRLKLKLLKRLKQHEEWKEKISRWRIITWVISKNKTKI